MEITDLLHRAHRGDQEALNSVVPLVYAELKRLAAHHLRRERSPGGGLQTTELVNEAFARMVLPRTPAFENRGHFFGIAARVMRQVLVDLARSRVAAKRGPGLEVPLANFVDLGAQSDNAVIALNDALDLLARDHPQKALLIELRFFGGFTAEESAAETGISVHTIRRELRFAQAWLHRELHKS